ncbi:MAG: RraA family protein [bacterium]
MGKSKMHLNKIREARDSHQELVDLPVPVEEMCERFERLFSGAVSDALRERILFNQVLPHDILPLERDMVLAGTAFTMKSVKASHTEGEMEFRGRLLQEVSENDVCIWYTGGDETSAHWGEIMTLTSRSRGARGAVVDGGLRDTKQVLQHNFPFSPYSQWLAGSLPSGGISETDCNW